MLLIIAVEKLFIVSPLIIFINVLRSGNIVEKSWISFYDSELAYNRLIFGMIHLSRYFLI